MFMSLSDQDSMILKTFKSSNCAVPAAGHDTSTWNTNWTKQALMKTEKEKLKPLNYSIMTNACKRN